VSKVNFLQLLSILLEFVIVILSLILVYKKKKIYGYGIALTFLIYVYYDLAKLFAWSVPEIVLSIFFLLATISMLLVVIKLIKSK